MEKNGQNYRFTYTLYVAMLMTPVSKVGLSHSYYLTFIRFFKYNFTLVS